MYDDNETQADPKPKSGHSGAHLAMMACCVIMLVPVAGFFLAGGKLGASSANLIAFAPLLLCVGLHFVMHKFMGKSCHSTDKKEENTTDEQPVQDVASTVPSVSRG
ncbi:DUF2933 domain-containing protein [Aliiroseovarius sp.]|uniref:DUF2933 domain-containing protein n=1 Tax=Aliiroseovarius sp. TaxID=1872442 RepID=UPI002624998A|nr:DUF2933 domain-containing protein [Aliiroseovarius sp.]